MRTLRSRVSQGQGTFPNAKSAGVLGLESILSLPDGVTFGKCLCSEQPAPINAQRGGPATFVGVTVFPVPPLCAELGSHPNCPLHGAFHNEPV